MTKLAETINRVTDYCIFDKANCLHMNYASCKTRHALATIFVEVLKFPIGHRIGYSVGHPQTRLDLLRFLLYRLSPRNRKISENS